jgi:large subunit ribosomal protein L10
MNREQKIEAVDEIAEQIEQSQAVFAIDYRGITVSEIASVRAQLGAADASFRVVKNSLTELAADKAGAEHLKSLLQGPTALTFVRGDAAAAAKAISTFNRETDLLPFKGGIMDGEPLEVEQIKIIARLPAREVLYGQLVGMVAAPVGGLVRGLGGLIGGLATALGQIQLQRADEPQPEAQAVAEPEAAPEAEAEAAPEAEVAPEAEAEAAPETEAEAEEAPTAEAEAEAEVEPEVEAEEAPAEEASSDNEADASA